MRNLIPFKTSPRVVATSLSPAAHLHGDVDRMLSLFLDDPRGFGGELARAQDSVRLDVAETEDEVVVRAEIPGVDPKDLELSLQGDVLTLAGEKKEEATRQDGGQAYTERRFGSFRRQIALPYPVETDKVRAECANGVLSIHLPKAEAARARRIEIQSA